MAWRGAAADGASDFLLLMEFQDRPEPLMALRVAAYAALAAKDFLDQRTARGEPMRALRVESLVLHHGDRPWNAPTRVEDILGGSGLVSYRLVARRPPGAAERGRLDLPEVALGLGGQRTVEGMQSELARIRGIVRRCGDPGFDRHVARVMVEMLASRGIPRQLLEEAMTMEAVVSAFKRDRNDLARKAREQGRRQGREQGIRKGREQGQAQLLRRQVAHRFGSAVEEEFAVMLAVPGKPERMRLLAEAVLECDSGAVFLERAREVVAAG